MPDEQRVDVPSSERPHWAPGSQSVPNDAQSPAHPARHRTRNALLALSCALLCISGLGLIWRFSGPRYDYPKTWDSRVTELVAFVERTKGQPFVRPIHVNFLTESAYEKRSTGNDDESEDGKAADKPTDEERQSGYDEEGFYRAVGLLNGKVDTKKANEDLISGGTAAFYDPDEKQIYVRGTELTIGTKGTIVHELTHAFQDQRYDLSKVLRTPEDQLGYDSIRTLTEGDAISVESAWYSALSESDRTEYEKENDAAVNEADDNLKDVPGVYRALFGSYYVLGAPFASVLLASDGERAIADAFKNPPTSTEQVLDPVRYLEGDKPKAVRPPSAPDDAELLHTERLGPVFWFVVLADKIDVSKAFSAVQGWGGDSATLYRRDKIKRGAVCVESNIEMETPKDANQLGASLRKWDHAMLTAAPNTDDRRSISVADKAVSVRLCDPGEATTIPVTGKAEEALSYPAIHSWLVVRELGDGAELADADCRANELMNAIPFQTFLDADENFATSDVFIKATVAAKEACPG